MFATQWLTISKMWINDQAHRECILESSAYLTERIVYYVQIQAIYITKPSKLTALLQDKVIAVYVELLKYSMKLKTIAEKGNIGAFTSFNQQQTPKLAAYITDFV
jgi:ribose 5-phosphate isomerase